MSTYTLRVEIEDAQLNILLENDLKLCLARRVNGDFNVVWKAKDPMEVNTFTWQENFEVFIAEDFQEGEQLVEENIPRRINFGQGVEIGPGGISVGPRGPVGGNSFTVRNSCKLAHIGVTQTLRGKALPIYVSRSAIPIGDLRLTPTPEVLLFFSREYTTGTMLPKGLPNTFRVKFAATQTQTVSYITRFNARYGGEWIFGPLPSDGKMAAKSMAARAYGMSALEEEAPPVQFAALTVAAPVVDFAALAAVPVLDPAAPIADTVELESGAPATPPGHDGTTDGVSDLVGKPTRESSEDTTGGEPPSLFATATFPDEKLATTFSEDITSYNKLGWSGDFVDSGITVGDPTKPEKNVDDDMFMVRVLLGATNVDVLGETLKKMWDSFSKDRGADTTAFVEA